MCACVVVYTHSCQRVSYYPLAFTRHLRLCYGLFVQKARVRLLAGWMEWGLRLQFSPFTHLVFFTPPTPSPPSACYHYKPVPSCYPVPVPVRHLSREAVDLAAAISTNHRAVFINAYAACITLPWWHFEFQHNQNKGQVFELCSSNDHVEPFSPRPKQQFYRTLSPAWMLKVPGTECFMVSCFAMSCLWNPSVSGAKSLLRHTVQTTVC